MKFFLLVLAVVAQTAYAQKTLSKESYQVSVRPVLNGIVNDFYQMVVLFPDFPKEVPGLVSQLDSLEEIKANINLGCPRILTAKCLPALDQLRGRLSNAETKVLELLARERFGSSPYINSLSASRLIKEFQVELTSFKGDLDNASLILRAGIKSKREGMWVLKRTDELKTMMAVSVVEYVPFNYREDFRHFYFNFVHPLEKNQSAEFMNRNFKSLNFALNLLNMNLTKRNKKTPEGKAPFLSLIHNRWNSILRYYF